MATAGVMCCYSRGEVWLTRGEVWISESERLVFRFLSFFRIILSSGSLFYDIQLAQYLEVL